jgi:hypothetical protein
MTILMEKLMSAWRLVRAAPWWLQALLAIILIPLLLSFLQNAGWLYVLSAVTLWTLAILGYLHEGKRLGTLRSVGPLVFVLNKVTAPREGIFRRKPGPGATVPLEEPATALYVDWPRLAATLKSRVIGQDRVCDEVARTLRIRLAMTRRTQPLAKFLFAGPPDPMTLCTSLLSPRLHSR